MRPCLISLLFGFVCAPDQPAVADPSGPPLAISIHVYDYAAVDWPKLAESESVAGRILAAAGIETRWRNCLKGFVWNGRSECAGADSAGAIVVRVLTDAMARKIALKPRQLGTSISTRPGVFPTDAYVFFGRISNLAADRGTPLSPLLGAAIAHEVGHLLLGDGSHTSSGIMRGQWGSKEFANIFTGRLRFSPEQAERIRAEVARRPLEAMRIGVQRD
jgi:hypothetical protein